MKKTILTISVLLFALAGAAWADSVTLAWDANNPKPEGYRLYQRVEGRGYNYLAPVWTGTATTCTIDGLAPGTTYYFIVRAFLGTRESGDSNEVKFTTGAVPDAGLSPAPRRV